MAHLEVLTFSSFLNLFTTKAVYVIGYSWLLGMSIWVSFFGGIIALKSLPRQQFGALQHKTFPIYFLSSIALSSGLIALWTRSHPHVVDNITSPQYADVAQVYALALVLVSQASNRFVIGPMTSKLMFQRHRLEKAEGKSYNDAGVSAEMKSLNRKFGSLHGISSLANLFAIFALIFHGLYIGNVGV